MPASITNILNDPAVRDTLKQAWLDSQPGVTGGHEEGGFILRDETGKMTAARWPRGEQDAIQMPPHPDCQVDGSEIVATFHTHPNTGTDYLQEPSDTDLRAVRDDSELKGSEYAGELVISAEIVYLISPAGRVREVGATDKILLANEGV